MPTHNTHIQENIIMKKTNHASKIARIIGMVIGAAILVNIVTCGESLQFVAPDGEVCACMVDKHMPTQNQCNRLTDKIVNIDVDSCE
jgi:hypothetical protein